MALNEALPKPSDLRDQAQQCLERAKGTIDPQVKRGLLGCAFALSQLAECIEVKQTK